MFIVREVICLKIQVLTLKSALLKMLEGMHMKLVCYFSLVGNPGAYVNALEYPFGWHIKRIWLNQSLSFVGPKLRIAGPNDHQKGTGR